MNPLYSESPYKNSPLNITRNEFLQMTEDEQNKWIEDFRQEIVKNYKDHNIPLGYGDKSITQIINNMKKFDKLNVSETFLVDSKGTKVVKNFNRWGNVVNFWFPEMMGVKIVKSNIKSGVSVFDTICEPEAFKKRMLRTVRDDKMYLFKNSEEIEKKKFDEKIKTLNKNFKMLKMLKKDSKNLKEEIDKLEKRGPDVRVYPTINQGIRLGLGTQAVVNFPTGVAKWMVEYGLKQFPNDKEYYIYDPCCGWGGRLMGILAGSKVTKKEVTAYLNDPNVATDLRFKGVKDFYEENVRKTNVRLIKFRTGAEFINTQSEPPIINTIHNQGHLAFTSPPYFFREQYEVDNENQSCNMYDTYEKWRDGFLTGLIKSVKIFLKPGGTFFLNIADIKISTTKVYPLATDSIRIAEENGLKLFDRYSMLMTTMVGNKGKENKLNFVEFEGKYWKCEPVLHFKKED